MQTPQTRTPTAAMLPALPAARSRAVELALAARAAATRRAYKSALARLGTWLDGRALTDATLADHVAWLAARGLAPASIGQAVAAACFLAEVAGWPPPRGTQTKDALRLVRREYAGRGRGQAAPITAEQATEIVARAAGRLRDAAITGLLFQAACAAPRWPRLNGKTLKTPTCRARCGSGSAAARPTRRGPRRTSG